jgi:hypothetical protein
MSVNMYIFLIFFFAHIFYFPNFHNFIILDYQWIMVIQNPLDKIKQKSWTYGGLVHQKSIWNPTIIYPVIHWIYIGFQLESSYHGLMGSYA